MNARNEAVVERKLSRNKELAAEEMIDVAEERKVALEENKVAMKENLRIMDHEKHLFFMDTSNLDERQKEYINICCDQVLARKIMMGSYMKGYM